MPKASEVKFEPSTNVGDFLGSKVGIYLDVPEDLYHEAPFCSQSFMWTLIDDSPMDAKYKRDHPEETKSTVLGSAMHTMVLEPDLLEERFVVKGKCESTTQTGKRCSRMGSVHRGDHWYCGQHDPGSDFGVIDPRLVMTSEEHAAAVAMAHRLKAKSWIRRMLNSEGPTELTILWRHEPTQVLIKCRIDKLDIARKRAMDLKSARQANKRGFSLAITKWGYDIQAATYMKACEAFGIKLLDFAFAVVKNTAPFGAALYRVDEPSVRKAWAIMEDFLPVYAECEAKKEWADYPEGPEGVSASSWSRGLLLSEDYEDTY